MRDHCDYISRPFSVRVADKVHRIAAATGLPLPIRKHNCKDCVSHSGFAVAVDFVGEPEREPSRTVFGLDHILNPDRPLGFVILGVDSPDTEVGLFRFDVNRV
jgi:hypothetical protein